MATTMKKTRRNPFDKVINQGRRLSSIQINNVNDDDVDAQKNTIPEMVNPSEEENQCVIIQKKNQQCVLIQLKLEVSNIKEEETVENCGDFIINSSMYASDISEFASEISPLSLSTSSVLSPSSLGPGPVSSDLAAALTYTSSIEKETEAHEVPERHISFLSPPPSIAIPDVESKIESSKLQELMFTLKQREEEMKKLQSDILNLKNKIKFEECSGNEEYMREVDIPVVSVGVSKDQGIDVPKTAEHNHYQEPTRSPVRSPMRPPRKSRYSLEMAPPPPLFLDAPTTSTLVDNSCVRHNSFMHQMSDETWGESSSVGGSGGSNGNCIDDANTIIDQHTHKSSRASIHVRQSLDTGGRRASLSVTPAYAQSNLKEYENKIQNSNICEYLLIGANKEYIYEKDGDSCLNMREMLECPVHSPPATVLERWSPKSCLSLSSSSDDDMICEVPLIQECCFPVGVPLSLVSPFEAKKLLILQYSDHNLQSQHVMQFPAPKDQNDSELYYSLSLISSRAVSNPNLVLVEKLRKQVGCTLAAVIISDFIQRVGGISAFVAFRFAMISRRRQGSAFENTPSSLWSSRKKNSNESLNTTTFDSTPSSTPVTINTPSTLTSYFKLAENALMKWQEAPSNQTSSSDTAVDLNNTSFATPKGKLRKTYSGNLSGQQSKEAAEYRRRSRAILNGPVVLITQQAHCILTRLQSHEVFLRLLSSIHEKSADLNINKDHIVMKKENITNDVSSKKSRKSFFRSLNQLKSEKYFMKKKSTYSNSKIVNQNQEIRSLHDDDVDTTRSDVDKNDENDYGGVDYFTDSDNDDDNEDKLESDTLQQQSSTTQMKSKQLERFYPLFEHVAFNSSLKDICGDWHFKFQPLAIEIHEQLSYASLEEWSLAVVFSVVPIKSIVRMIHLLLCESKIVVRGSDVGLVSIVAASLPRLLAPLTWECVHIPLKPISLTANDLVDCPTPFIVGIVSSSLSQQPCMIRDINGNKRGEEEIGSNTFSYEQHQMNDYNYVKWLTHRYHPLSSEIDETHSKDMPGDVSLLDLDAEEETNMLKEAEDFQNVLNWGCSSESSSLLSNQLCNDILQILKGEGGRRHGSYIEEEDEEDDDEEDSEEEDEFIDGFCHNKEFFEHQCNEVNERCNRCFGPLEYRESLKSFFSSNIKPTSSGNEKNKIIHNGGNSEKKVISSMNSRMRLFSQLARLYACGLTAHEMEKISNVRDVLRKFISSLCDDVGSNWSKYGETHPQQGFEFIPNLFLGPRTEKLAIQSELVHSQMFHFFVAKHRQNEEDRARAVMKNLL